MPYTVALPDGRRVEFPDSVSKEQASQIIQAQFFSEQPSKEESGFFRQAADVPVQIASGVTTGIRLLADSFGADNPVSQNIRGVEGYLQGLLSAQAKNDQQEIARIMKEAEDKGIAANLVAALKAFTTAPVDLIAQAVGTAAPTIAGGLAAAALRAPALVASTGIGATMGAGAVKGSIYEEVKQTLAQLGASPEEAESRAVKAQEYGGENLDQILLGTVIGGVTGRFGIESTAAKALAKDIASKTVAKAAAAEAVPEAVQAGQEQVAQNIALQREGVDVPTFRGAVGAGALEALAGLGVGALGEVAARQIRPEPEAAPEEPPVTPEPPEAPEVSAEAEPPVPEGTVRVYHSGSRGEGETGRWVSTNRTYAKDYRPDLPLFFTDIPANDPRLQGATPDQGAAQGFTFNFELTPEEATQLRPVGEEPAPSRDLLLEDIEEVVEPEDEAARVKFEETVKKVREGEAPADITSALDLARTKVQESGKTAAPYIQNAVNKNLPDQKITLTEAGRIRDQLIEEGTIVKNAQGKFAAAKPSAEVAAVEEAESVPATADVEVVSEVERGRRGKRAGVPVSGEPTVTTTAEPTGTVDTRVETATSTAAKLDRGTEPSTTPLTQEVVENPKERYESLQRRLEGLVNAKRITPIIANRIRTTLTQNGNPLTNPEGYAPLLNQVEDFIVKQEQYAESLEADNTAAGVDQRERNLKAQENNALQRAQNQIEQDKIAQSLRDRYDRGLSEEEVMPKQSRKIRDALEGNDLKSVTQMLVEPASAVDVYPKNVEKYRPIFMAVARKLNDVDFSNVRVVTEATPGADLNIFRRLKDELKTAEYDPADNTLYVRRDKVFANTIMHELVHAGTVQTIRQYELDKSKLTDVQRLGVARLMGLFDFVQLQEGDVSLVREFPDAFGSVYEFIAYGLTSADFQARLARIEVPMPVGRKNMWTEFVKAIGNLLNIKFKSEKGTSALDEVGQAFSEILAAPVKEGVTGVSPLAERERKKAEKAPRPEIDPYEETAKKYDEIFGDKLSLKGLLKDRFSQKNIEKLVETFQDRQRYLLRLQTDLDRAGLAIWAAAEQKGNTLAAANDESAGRYENNEKALAPLMLNMNKAMSAYAAKTGMSVEASIKRLSTYFTAEANQVRRLTNYWKEKPLKTTPTIRLKGSDKLISYAQYRDMLIDSVLTDKPLDDRTREAIHNKLLQLVGIEIGPDGKPRKTADADKYADPLGASYSQLDKEGKARIPGKRPLDFDDPYYDIIKDWGYAKNEKIIGDMEKDMVKNGAEIRAVKKAMEALDKMTMKFNEEATHLTQPAKNLIKLYGWGDKYVPLMGKVKSESSNRDQFIYMNTVPNEILPGFRGRETAPDNPLLMTMVNAGKAATRAARADIVPTLVNLMKPHPVSGKKYVKGEMVGVIKFKDRYKGEINFEETDGKGGKKWVGQNKFYNYLKNGDIEVWRVDDERIIQSLRPDWEPTKILGARAKNAFRKITSWIGQGHTRYQLKFAIYDFPRNLFANAGALASEMGGATASKYIASVGNEVFLRARIPQVWRIANAHFNGDWNTIKKIGGYNEKTGQWKDAFVREAYQYLQRGGKISIVRSWQTRSRLEELIAVANKSDIRKGADKSIAALNKIFDLWLDGFELVARVQAYRVAKSYATNTRKMPEVEAEQYGVYFAKNLANFEKRALTDIPATLYAFWPPSATGAVRAIDAITPAVRLTTPRILGGSTIENILEELPEEIKSDPKARAAYAKRYEELKRNGQAAIGFYAGAGFMFYMMALSLGSAVKELYDDEENPKNPVQNDSKELWTRNIRIPLDWLDLPTLKDKYFQIPWGFGMGAFGAIGAQVAAVVTNGQTKSDFIGNVATIGVDSFLPLPFARYNPLDSPFNWFMSSVLPTSLRPFFEYGVNMNGLGQTIYRSYYNRFGPAFSGSENVEEMYRDIAKAIREASLGKYTPDPNTIRYFLTSYIDGIAAFGADAYNIWLTYITDQKDFDPKTDLIFIDNFIGNKVSPSFVKFEEANNELEAFKKRYDSFIVDPDSENTRRFLAKYPDAPAIVSLYNKQISNLRRFREMTTTGEIYADTPQERKDYKKEMNKIRDVYMDQVAALYEAYKDKMD